jgi:hypothetical protein
MAETWRRGEYVFASTRPDLELMCCATDAANAHMVGSGDTARVADYADIAESLALDGTVVR